MAAFRGFEDQKARNQFEREQLGDKIARAIAPAAWKEYDQEKGSPTNAAGWACTESIYAAGRVLDLLHKLGFPVAAKSRKRRHASR